MISGNSSVNLRAERDGCGDGFGSMWRIADVTTHVDSAGITTCDVAPLHPPGHATGFDVRVGDVTY